MHDDDDEDDDEDDDDDAQAMTITRLFVLKKTDELKMCDAKYAH